MKKIVKELIYTNYKWNKKKDRLVGIKGSEELHELGFHVCDLCGVASAKVAAVFLEFTPRGWAVLTVTTPGPLEDDVTYDICESCTSSTVNLKALPLIKGRVEEKLT